MAKAAPSGKLYPFFTLPVEDAAVSRGTGAVMSYFATAIFVALFLVGPTYFGWSDPSNKVSLALITAFLLGGVSGYKARD
jgi:hypothetical protein